WRHAAVCQKWHTVAIFSSSTPVPSVRHRLNGHSLSWAGFLFRSMLVAYEKPHKNLNEQVAIMQDRGMDTGELKDAVAYLKRIGYYRLSAYSYPLRQWTGHGADAKRAETFIEGTTLDQVV